MPQATGVVGRDAELAVLAQRRGVRPGRSRTRGPSRVHADLGYGAGPVRLPEARDRRSRTGRRRRVSSGRRALRRAGHGRRPATGSGPGRYRPSGRWRPGLWSGPGLAAAE